MRTIFAPRGGVCREVGEGSSSRAASGQQRETERDGGGPEGEIAPAADSPRGRRDDRGLSQRASSSWSRNY